MKYITLFFRCKTIFKKNRLFYQFHSSAFSIGRETGAKRIPAGKIAGKSTETKKKTLRKTAESIRQKQ